MSIICIVLLKCTSIYSLRMRLIKNIKNIHKIKYSNENKTKLTKLNC